MSLLKIIKAQLGLSTTPANNFVLDASAQDGTLKLSRGNEGATTQDVLVVDAAGKVTFPVGSQMLGVGQTWQAVTRVGGQAYTNDTDKPIVYAVSAITSANNVMGNISIQFSGGPSVTVATAGGGGVSQTSLHGSIVIPSGATYTLTYTNISAGAIVHELR